MGKSFLEFLLELGGESENFIQEAQGRRLSPTVITYSSAISACEKTGEWQQAGSPYSLSKRCFSYFQLWFAFLHLGFSMLSLDRFVMF